MGANFKEFRSPADMVDKARISRNDAEAAVELDDGALAADLDGKEPVRQTLKRSYRKGRRTGGSPGGAGRL